MSNYIIVCSPEKGVDLDCHSVEFGDVRYHIQVILNGKDFCFCDIYLILEFKDAPFWWHFWCWWKFWLDRRSPWRNLRWWCYQYRCPFHHRKPFFIVGFQSALLRLLRRRMGQSCKFLILRKMDIISPWSSICRNFHQMKVLRVSFPRSLWAFAMYGWKHRDSIGWFPLWG